MPEKVPPSGPTLLDKLKEEIEQVSKQWSSRDIGVQNIIHDAESLWMSKATQQALINVLCKTGKLDEEELNVEFHRVILNDMKRLVEQYDKEKEEYIAGRTGISLPSLLGPDGRPVKI